MSIEETAEFNNVTFDSKIYESIKLESDNSGRQKNRTSYVSLISLNKLPDNNYLKHYATLNWNDNPGSYSSGTDTYSPSLTSDSHTRSYSTSRYLGTGINGEYYFTKKVSAFCVWWNIGYAESKFANEFTQEGFSDIKNFSKERIWKGAALFYYQFTKNANIFRIVINSRLSDYHTSYSGCFNSLQKLTETFNSAYITYNRIFGQNYSLHISGGAMLNTVKFNDRKKLHNWSPTAEAYFDGKVSDNGNIKAWGGFRKITSGVSAINQAIVQKTPLIWHQGNPEAHHIEVLYAGASYTWIPTDRFNLTGTAYNSHIFNPWQIIWEYAIDGKNGIIKKAINDGSHNFTFFSANVYWKPAGIITLQGSLWYRMSILTGINDNNYNEFYGDMTVNFFIRNFLISGYFSSPIKDVNYDGDAYGGFEKTTWNYGISASYSVGDLSVTAEFNNWFDKTVCTDSWFNSAIYSFSRKNRISGRGLSVTLSYTIPYGKLTDRSISPEKGETIKSSVLGN